MVDIEKLAGGNTAAPSTTLPPLIMLVGLKICFVVGFSIIDFLIIFPTPWRSIFLWCKGEGGYYWVIMYTCLLRCGVLVMALRSCEAREPFGVKREKRTSERESNIE